FAESFHINIQEVIIYNLVEGVFFAKLLCNDGKKVLEIDARTSDAIALAVRFNAPIYTYEFILASAGIIIEGNDFLFLDNIDTVEEPNQPKPKSTSSKESFSSYSIEEL